MHTFSHVATQDAQAAMETELAAAVTQADAAQGEADEVGCGSLLVLFLAFALFRP